MRKMIPLLGLLLLNACQKEPLYHWHNQKFEVLNFQIAMYRDGEFSSYLTTCDTTYDCRGSLHFDEKASIAWLMMIESSAFMSTERSFSQSYTTNRRGELYFHGRPISVTQIGGDTLYLDWEIDYEWQLSHWLQKHHLEIVRAK